MWFRGRKHPSMKIDVTIAVSETRRKRAPRIQEMKSEIVVPTDLLLIAWRQLFPAERMVVFGGRVVDAGVAITSHVDVTEPNPSSVHVKACPQRLAQALIDFERTGVHLAMW